MSEWPSGDHEVVVKNPLHLANRARAVERLSSDDEDQPVGHVRDVVAEPAPLARARWGGGEGEGEK
jgi:hypothetical protein